MAQQKDSARLAYQKGLEETSLGRHKPAFEQYRKATEKDSTYVEAWRAMGQSALHLKYYDIAKSSFKKVLAADSTDLVAVEAMGNLSFWTHRWDDAIYYGRKMMDYNIGSRVNYMVGKSYYEKEDYGKAFRYLDAAYKEEPKNAEIPFLFARSFVDMSNYTMAVKYYREAIELDTSKVQWIYELAMAYSAMPNDSAAIVYFEKAIAKGYKIDQDFMENLATAYVSAGKPERGLAILQGMLEKRPADLELLYFIADTHYKMGKYDDAISYWDKILAYDKKQARSLYMIGLSLQKKGEIKRGQAICDKAIEMDPSLKAMRRERQGM